jgi:hypothetical protein
MLRDFEARIEEKRRKQLMKQHARKSGSQKPQAIPNGTESHGLSDTSSSSSSDESSSVYDSSDLEDLFPGAEESPKIAPSPVKRQLEPTALSLEDDEDNQPLSRVVDKVRHRKAMAK